MSNEHITPLSDQVRRASFQDARHTTHDPVLLGPPTLEFAPYAKTPGSRVRKDARQGTIDQDPDFIAFLESLTQPITKPALVDTAESEEKKDTVATTPLVQFIKEKKASKAKDGSKSSKREKESKQEKVQAKKLLQRTDKESAPGAPADKKGKGDKTSKESTKAAKQAAATTKAGKATSKESKEASGPASEKKRERGNVAAAAKILQRDLGISSSGGRRRGKGGSAETGSPSNEASQDSAVPTTDDTKKESIAKSAKGADSAASSGQTKDRESPAAKASDAATPTAANPPASKPAKGAKSKSAASPAPTATQAFLKHANPSQGVTEALLEAAFTPFGTVTKVEIDKKKGFGYVDFAEPEGLQKAMAASPVSVAQGQVVVLERKANPGGEKPRKGRGDSQQPNGGKAKGGEGTNGGNQSSSRGSRGGRGSRNKGKGSEGSKGGGGQAAAGEKAGEVK